MKFELHEQEDHPLHEDGLKVFDVEADENAIVTHDDVLEVATSTDVNSVILFKRRIFSIEYQRYVIDDALNKRASSMDYCSYWSPTSGASIQNAKPHRHNLPTLVGAPMSSAVSTALFSTGAIIDAAEAYVADTQNHIGMIECMKTALAQKNINTDEVVLFGLLAVTEFYRNKYSITDADMLSSIIALQSHAKEHGGMYEVDLDTEGHGIVVVPSTCTHARNVTVAETRRDFTAWRFFKPNNSSSR